LELEALVHKNMKYLGLIILFVLGALLFGFRAITLTGQNPIGYWIMVVSCLATVGVVIYQGIKHK
jgi:hypothetical protein